MIKPEHLAILIIEDNSGDQVLLQENLLSTALSIEKISTADTLKEGMELLKRENFSLVFLDLFLPDSQGLDALSNIISINSNLPVVIFSGLADTEIAVRAITLGAQDFLIKGDYTNSLLEKTVRYSIERKHNLDALEESNSKYRTLSSVTHDMVWDWDLKTDNVYRNTDGWKKIFRTKDDVIINSTEDWPKKVHLDDIENFACLVKNAIESPTQKVFEAEFRIVRDDGTVGFLEDRGYIIRDEDGLAIRIIGASHDITERKEAEQKVLQSEQRFRSLVQNSNDLLAIVDTEGNYLYVSPSSFKILGYEPEIFIGKNAFEFIHPEEQSQTMEALSSIFTNKSIVVPLFRFQNAAGEWRWIESTISNRLDDPAISGIVVNSRDVTEKKISDDEIEKLSMVAKNTLSGVFILDKERRITWVNEAFTRITEFTAQDVIGKTPSSILFGENPDPSLFSEVRDRIIAGKSYEGERNYYTKSGRAICVWLQLQVLFNKSGQVEQYFGVQTDITLQKELEKKVEVEKTLKQKEITEAVYSAQESERSEIGRELHDNVNQLLGAIKLYVNMAKTDDEERESLLNDASDFTLTAIEEIRKLSKTLITPLIKEVGLVDSIKELADEIMIVHPLRIHVHAEHFIDQEYNDKFKLNLFRICQEQLNNIIKHAHASVVKIELKPVEARLQISIEDNGVGFDTTKRKKGIGITNIKSRSELFNGIVDLKSEPGKGTSLSVLFEKSDLISPYKGS